MLTSEKGSKEPPDDVYATIFNALSIGIKQNRHLAFQNPVQIECQFHGSGRSFVFNRPIEFHELLSRIRAFYRQNNLSLFSLASNRQGVHLRIQSQVDLDDLVSQFDTAEPSLKCIHLVAAADEYSPRQQRVSIGNHHSWTGVISCHDDRESPPPGTLPQMETLVPETPSLPASSCSEGIFIPEQEDDAISHGSTLSRSRSSLESFSSLHSTSGAASTQLLTSSDIHFRNGTYPKTKSASDFHENFLHELFPPYTYPRRERRQMVSTSGSFGSLCSSDSISSCCKPTWRRGRELGCGPFGHVILCYEEQSGREVAAKVIDISSQDDSVIKEVKELKYDIQLLKGLCHDRIVRYFGSHDNGHILSIFMEYITGGSVTDQIREYGPLTENVCRSYLRQILEGLVYLHNLEIVHRDIKASNILRDRDGNVKLTDFGTLKRLQVIITKSKSGVDPEAWTGNPHHLAPEVIKGDGYGRKADIWSLGCTVIEMLTGKLPWHELSRESVVSKIKSHSFPFCVPPEDVSEPIKTFLLSCFHISQEERWSAGKLLTHLC